MTMPVKQYAIFLLIFLSLIILHRDANALSIEIRAGSGTIEGLDGNCTNSGNLDNYCNSAYGSYKKAEVDLLFSPWKRVDLFTGIEYMNADNMTQNTSGNIQPMNYSLDVAGITFGLRFKPIVSDKWHLYLMMGGLAGKAYYTADFNGQTNIVPLSSNRGSEYFIEPRVGIGAVIGLSKRLGIGIEAAITKSFPAFNMSVINNSTGQVEERRLNNGTYLNMLGMTLGLRYSF